MQYPYFAYEALKNIPTAASPQERDKLRRIVAVNVGDPDVLCEILGLNTESLADFYPDSLPPNLSTLDTIDCFISKYGNENSAPAEPLYAESSPVTPLSDEAVIESIGRDLPAQAAPADDPTFSAIDAFLKAVPAPQPKRPKKITPKEENPNLTESFAKILIKNQNYTKALQIIQELNLNNPEKSVYFADQIRFLKKLIINQRKQSN